MAIQNFEDIIAWQKSQDLAADIIISAPKVLRENWAKQFESAIAAGELPENDVFNAILNHSDQTEWTW